MKFHRIPLETSDLGMKSTYLRMQVPEEYKNHFTKLVDNIQGNFDQHKEFRAHDLLAGQIKHEYIVSLPDELYPFIGDAVINFHEKNNQILNRLRIINEEVDIEIENDSVWVNFQQKYEYNPIHDHSGILSWVYYHKVPYLLEEEDKFFNDSTKEPLNGRFVFYPNLGHWISLDIDNRHEGTLIMFPSTLFHAVYPFYTSNEYRITVAGNAGIRLK